MPYVEFPGDEITEVHFKKKDGEPPGGDDTGALCIPEFEAAGVLYNPVSWCYVEGANFWINPWACCPPSYYPNEADYGQKTVWGGHSLFTRITMSGTYYFPPISIHGGIDGSIIVEAIPERIVIITFGIWVFPRVAWTSWDKCWIYSANSNGSIYLIAPKGEPYLYGSPAVWDIPRDLQPSDIPGAPPPDPGVSGTTIIIAPWSVSAHEALYGNYGGERMTLLVQHECGPKDFPPPLFPRSDLGVTEFQRPGKKR
jgi:hypothetical protein